MHGKKRKIKRTGRHASPSPLRKITRRTGKVAPAVALAGALVATPFIFHLGSSAPSMPGDAASAHQVNLTHKTQERQARSRRRASSRHHASRHHASTHHASGRQAAPGTPGGSAAPAASASPASSAHRAPASPAAPGGSADPSHSPAPSSPSSPKPSGPVCDGTSGLLPQNYGAIVTFLMSHGYTGLAAAGIAGNIYRESVGNPESVGTGGGGLIGWTPLPPGFVTGNPTADLQFQLRQLLVYNQQYPQFIPALNAATSAREAAFIYMSDFERPGIPATEIREEAAESVAAACHL